MGSFDGFLSVVPERKNLHLLHCHLLPALSCLQLRLDYFNLYASLHWGITIYGHYFFQD